MVLLSLPKGFMLRADLSRDFQLSPMLCLISVRCLQRATHRACIYLYPKGNTKKEKGRYLILLLGSQILVWEY